MRNNMNFGREHRRRPSAWYQIYFAAVLETDQKRALLKISRAQNAIQERLEQLRRKPANEINEVQDLNSALTYLSLLMHHVSSAQEDETWD
ncbi:MAG TPA: hypothetical protein VGS27_11910 [Candidatus Sulfotelmatobacter sp.]|nr:hypothetical protein [Candidatus Sulfotelmatobacter sp.]